MYGILPRYQYSTISDTTYDISCIIIFERHLVRNLMATITV